MPISPGTRLGPYEVLSPLARRRTEHNDPLQQLVAPPRYETLLAVYSMGLSAPGTSTVNLMVSPLTLPS